MTTSSVSNVDQILGVSCTIQNRFITITETMLNDVLGLPTANFVSVPTEEERTTFFHQGGYLKSYMSLISQKNGTFPSPVCPMSLHQRLPDFMVSQLSTRTLVLPLPRTGQSTLGIWSWKSSRGHCRELVLPCFIHDSSNLSSIMSWLQQRKMHMPVV